MEIYKYRLVKRGENRMKENKNGATTSNKEREERRGGKGKSILKGSWREGGGKE